MADPQRGDQFDDEDEGGGGESTVSMASPTLDPAMPSPISVPPPPFGGPGAPPGMPNMGGPTAPQAFAPQQPPAFPMAGQRPAAGGPSVPTPFGGITPGGPGGPGGPPPSNPRPAAGAPAAVGATGAHSPARAPVTSAMGADAVGPAGMKRPQTVIGLAPPPVGAPRPGQAGGANRGVPLPSGKGPAPVSSPRPAAGAAATPDKGPPSSGRGVKPPSVPKSVGSSPKNADADSTDEQFAIGDSIPDSQKEDMATMAKSPEESLALFGLDSGLTDAARAAVVPKPGPAAGAPPPRSPLASTNLAQNQNRPLTPNAGPVAPASKPIGPPPLPPPSAPVVENALPVLHDRTEEEESTRAVSREEMLRGHDAVIIGDDAESAQGEDATLAVGPGFNEANTKNIAAFAESLQKEASQMGQAPFGQNMPPPAPMPGAPPGFDPGFGQHLPPQQQGYPGAPNMGTMQSPQQGWPQQDPNAGYPQQPPQQPWQDPNAGYPQPPQSYSGMQVGPVSGPHLPAQSWTPQPPQSQPHFPGASHVPQSQPHLQVPQSGHMMAQPQQGMAPSQQGGPIPFPGNWNANPPLAAKRPFKLSGQILGLAIVGAICLAIFITGIVLFATTKF